ncbi:type II 3-dehydroquinate dehydratase, partial [Escherichia coli]|nr:type II 3-dehydroquinate dehydratase [Escherichia coli]
ILLLHGPNLNLLSSREPGLYGQTSLEQLNAQLIHEAVTLGHELICFQSNAEFQLIDKIQQARNQGYQLLMINAAALTHTSI